MKITNISIKRPVTTFMVVLIILLFGSVAYFNLNIDLLPSFDLPMLMVVTSYPGAGPEEVEALITDPFESILATTSNVKEISSVSAEGSSTIMISFVDGTDMDFAGLEVRENIDRVKALLPTGAVQPMIMKMNPSMLPISNFGVTFKGQDLGYTSNFVNNILKPTLERVDGIARVEQMGGVIRELRIIVDPDRLSSYGINMSTLTQLIKAEYMSLPGGIISEGSYKLVVRTLSSANGVEGIENLTLMTNDNKLIKLKDLATLEKGYKAPTSFSKINGEDSLVISIQKESTGNTAKVSTRTHEALAQLQGEYPDLEMKPIFDQGEIINKSVSAVGTNAIAGGVLAVLVIFLFLKDFRTTLIMGVSIPISVIATFVLIYFSGLTLNMISLGGVALGVGMLVDNAIVVIENIYRLKQQGLSNEEAAYQGTSEVAQAVTASTLTTISVFLPVVFVKGISAQIFKEMALTVTFSLIASLVVSFTLVPLLAAKLLNEKKLGKSNSILDRLREQYKKLLRWSLAHKKSVIALMLIVIIMGGVSFWGVGSEFFPAADQGVVYVNVELPKGKDMASILKLSEEVLERIVEVEGIETTAINTNSSSSTGQIILVLQPKNQRKQTDTMIAKQVRELVWALPGATITTNTSAGMMSMGGGSSIALDLVGQDLKVLEQVATQLLADIGKVQGVIDTNINNERNASELRVVINQEEAIKYGLNSYAVAQSIQAATKESSVTQLLDEEGSLQVNIYSHTALESGFTDIENIILSSPAAGRIPIREIASFERSEGYHQIERSNQSRKLSLTIEVEGRSTGEVSKDIEKILVQHELPGGYKVSFSGQIKEMKEAFSMLFTALILAVLLVYMVMAAQFESFLYPLIIMITVPLAFAGGLISLLIADVTVSIPTILGFVMLSGIVVNNGIVLVDFINRLKKQGLSTYEAILEAGPVRLQPILMTTLTTILGLLPMTLGIGEGAEMLLPLAVTVTGGLIFATLLTLIAVPVIYSSLK